MDAEVTVRFQFKNVIDEEGLPTTGLSFDEVVRECITSEGLWGVVEDEYEILNVVEVARSEGAG